DYGIAKRDKREPTVMDRVPDEIPPLAGAIVTRSKAKQLQLQQDQNSTTIPIDRNMLTLPPIDRNMLTLPPIDRNMLTLPPIEEETDQMKEDPSQIIAKNTLDIEQLKIEQGKDPD
ncbi:unnamed protein product, partial [Rotaria sordida]